MQEDVFNNVLTASGDTIIKELHKMRGNTDNAEDAYHEAVISALKRGPRSFESVTKLMAYLAASAHGDLITQRGRDALRWGEEVDLDKLGHNPEKLQHQTLDIEKALMPELPAHRGLIQEMLTGRISISEGAEEAGIPYMTMNDAYWRVKERLT